ncbi:hypothetical protein RCOM_0693780 [Ricinus communis]|uniref:RNase H type-1 domain-containing protein n=1 Tax=Ricinus communis TaxID=3988 RepID=B9S855_RICCO|nr:hypothetical protein RCOM_0693780 [Ricinus communis]
MLPSDPIIVILSKARHFNEASKMYNKVKGVESTRRVERLVGWNRPSVNCFIIDTDGFVKENGIITATSGIIHDYCGAWICQFMTRLGSCNSVLAELWGMLHGL